MNINTQLVIAASLEADDVEARCLQLHNEFLQDIIANEFNIAEAETMRLLNNKGILINALREYRKQLLKIS